MTLPKKLQKTSFDILTDDCLEEIAVRLPIKDRVHLACIRRDTYQFFKQNHLESYKLTQLLEHVVRGEQDQAQHILMSYPELLTQTGSIMDYSGRKFENITAFEYALWALDRHMWNMMRYCVFKSPKSEEIKQNLLAQYHRLRNEGISYTLGGKLFQESHYNFALIDRLQEYESNSKSWSRHESLQYWQEKILNAQAMVPAHVANEYCRPDRSSLVSGIAVSC